MAGMMMMKLAADPMLLLVPRVEPTPYRLNPEPMRW